MFPTGAPLPAGLVEVSQCWTICGEEDEPPDELELPEELEPPLEEPPLLDELLPPEEEEPLEEELPPAAATLMLKDGNAADASPSLTLITMPE